MKVISDIQKGYIAGFIDGEGNIRVQKVNRTKNKGRNYTTYQGQLQVASTNKESLENIVNMVGLGTVSKRKRRNPKHKTLFVWRMGQKDMASLLPEIVDHLFIKKESAALMIEYVGLMSKYPNFSEEEIDRVTFIRNRFETINVKGPDSVIK